MKITTKEEAIQLQEEFLRALEDAYTYYSFLPVYGYLHEEVHYHSFYVFQEFHSRSEYMTYLDGKLTNLKRAHREYHFAMMVYNGGYPFLLVTNARDEQGGYMGFYAKNDENGVITEIGLVPASMMRLAYKNEEEKQKVEQYCF